MKICGLQKTTLLDFPGHVAATIFLGGCNFRCPYCHNSELLGSDAPETLSIDELLSFLNKRKGILEGVCVTGGEPTLHPELPILLMEIRKLGYLIKLDSNGTNPEFLKQLFDQGLVDYIAMDIKNCPEKYGMTAGCGHIDLNRLKESIDFLLGGTLPYEFRTTVVRQLHTAEDITGIGAWIQGAERYFLQNYKDSPQVLTPGYSDFTKEELIQFASFAKPYVKEVSIRGVDY